MLWFFCYGYIGIYLLIHSQNLATFFSFILLTDKYIKITKHHIARTVCIILWMYRMVLLYVAHRLAGDLTLTEMITFNNLWIYMSIQFFVYLPLHSSKDRICTRGYNYVPVIFQSIRENILQIVLWLDNYVMGSNNTPLQQFLASGSGYE